VCVMNSLCVRQWPLNGCVLPVYLPCTSCTACFRTLSRHGAVDIANFIYQHPTLLDLQLQGIWLADRESHLVVKPDSEALTLNPLAVIGWDVEAMQIPAVNLVHKYEHVFSFKSAYSLLNRDS